MAFLELAHVSKGYGDRGARTEVLHDINLTVERGEFVAIVGYSGAGKTTLMSMISGLAVPDAGTVTLDGEPILGPGADRGVVFQNYSLLPWLTAYENVLLAVDQKFAGWSRARKREHAERHLALVNLAAARDKRPSEMSGGMRQRVAVARALAMDPEVLLLDEPLGALDALTRATLQDEISRIFMSGGGVGDGGGGEVGAVGGGDGRAGAAAGRKTALLITNDVDEGILLADRIIPLSIGPKATLGPAIPIDIPRPRDRKAMNHDERFKHARNQVIEYLLGPGRRKDQPPPRPEWVAATAETVAA